MGLPDVAVFPKIRQKTLIFFNLKKSDSIHGPSVYTLCSDLILVRTWRMELNAIETKPRSAHFRAKKIDIFQNTLFFFFLN